jgi:hypothetical protein
MNFYGLSSKRRRGGVPFSWTARTSSFSGTQIEDVASDGAGTYVAVGSAGKLATSTNAGVTWTQRTSSFSGSDIYGVAYDAGNSIWIATGAAGKVASAAAADVTSWTQRTSNFAGNAVLGVGSDGSGNSVIVGLGSKLSDSTNGTTWTARTSTFTTFGNEVAFGNSIWVAVGADDEISTSTNRIAWTDRANPFTSTFVRGVVYGAPASIWVAVAYNGQISSAPDPTSTWTARTSGLTASDNIHCVAYGNGYFLAGADDGLDTYSTDGINWTNSTIPAFTAGSDDIRAVAYDATDDIWVAVGIGGILATSPGS